jgi:hypothetical protein
MQLTVRLTRGIGIICLFRRRRSRI